MTDATGGQAFDPWAVHVLIPDDLRGVTVCSLGELMTRADDADSLEELRSDAGMDSAGSDADVLQTIDKVRKLNATGDADAYWNT